MPYSMIIADDELMMRNGLTGIIDWGKLGFQVDAVFSDGSEVLEYLKANVPDVLLSDIRMSKVSGLEVTSFITENRLPTKVVLISGYKDFEYARQALANNVEDYLLKPVSVPKLREVFTALREKLEQQDVLDTALRHRLDRYSQMVHLRRCQLFLEAVIGVLTPQQFQRQLALVEIDEQEENTSVFLFNLLVEQDSAFQSLMMELGSQEVEEQFSHLMESFDQRLEFYMLESDPARMLCLFREKGTDGYLRDRCGKNGLEQQLTVLFQSLLGVAVHIEAAHYMESLRELPGLRVGSRAALDPHNVELTQDYFHRLQETKKLVLSYLQDGKEAAKEYCDALVELTLKLGIGTAQSHLLHLLTIAAEKLAGDDARQLSSLLTSLTVETVSSVHDREAMLQWGRLRMDMLLQFVVEQEHRSGGGKANWIQTVQRYIRENYHEDISLRTAAEVVYLNPIYVSRIFREVTGQTFTEYLSKVRIDKAVEYLRDTGRYVYEISPLVGYQDIKYFYKVFRKLRGCSPSEYREATQDNNRNA